MMVNFWKIFSKMKSFYLLCHFQYINPDHSNVHRLLEPLWSLQWRERVFWCQIEIQLESHHMVLQLWWYIKLNVCWRERSKTFHWSNLNCSPRIRPIVPLLIKSLHAEHLFRKPNLIRNTWSWLDSLIKCWEIQSDLLIWNRIQY